MPKVRELTEYRDAREEALARKEADPGLPLPTREEWAKMDAEQDLAGRDWVWRFLPRVRPPGYERFVRGLDGITMVRKDGLAVIASGSVESDGLRWLHVSASRAKGLPTYHDLVGAKLATIGPVLYAYQVFAPPADHVNLGEVLHLWACVDLPAYLPDFTRGYGTI